MSQRPDFPRWRACAAALSCLLAMGCSTLAPTAAPAPAGAQTPRPAAAAAAAPAPRSKAEKVAALRQMGFVPAPNGLELTLLVYDAGTDHVSEEGIAVIVEMARTLSALGIERVTIEGHTDNVGNAANNVKLSQRRAEAVAEYLVNAGWRDDAIARRGYGAARPIATNATAAGRGQNRRVVVGLQVD